MDVLPVRAGDQVAAIVGFFEQLTPQTLRSLDRVYTPSARFLDPFNDVQGVAAIHAVYRHMFESLQDPRFVVTNRVVDRGQCFLVWDFSFRFRARPTALQTIHGASHLVLDTDGRISLHRDYWDAAGELYEKLPVLGGLMRWLRKRAAG